MRLAPASFGLASPVLWRIAFGVVAAFIAYGIWFILTGPLFRIQHVEVVGATIAGSEAVQRAAALEGANPFRISAVGVATRVEALGAPQHVTVAYQLPDRAVIQVAERLPTYVWLVGSRHFLVSDDGTVLGDAVGLQLYPVLVDDDQVTVQPGSLVDRRALVEASYLVSVVPRVGGFVPADFHVNHAWGLTATGPKGIRVRFGNDQNLDDRLADLMPTLAAALAARPVPSLLDISVLHRPYYR